MGIVRPSECERSEIEEFHRMLLTCARRYRKKEEDESRDQGLNGGGGAQNELLERKPVCVTNGVSFLGLAIVNRLLLRGYSVTVIVNHQEDLERLGEMESNGASEDVRVVVAKLTEIESLVEAFDGCCGVFHTADFIDPSGLSGYSKHMADLEVKASENVMEACARTSSVRRCVLTSSLLACIWLDISTTDLPSVINHHCWSDETLCINKKLWYALGKLRAEQASWRVAEERGLKLASICPGLITGPGFCTRNPTPSIAYLKGAQEMYPYGLLATIDVERVAEAHVCVFDAMGKNKASGRYVCFDRIVGRGEDLEELAQQTGIQMNWISSSGNGSSSSPLTRFRLSSTKLSTLMSTTQQCRNEC